MSDKDDDNVISELPEFSPKSDYSKARLAEQFTLRILDLRSKDMKEGFWNKKEDKYGNFHSIWVTDTRKQYIASVEAFVALMTPEIYSDKRAVEALNVFQSKKDKIFNKWAYKEKFLKDGKWIETGRVYLPRIGQPIPTRSSKYPLSNKHFEMVEGIWDGYVNSYWDELIELYDNLFSEINLLIGSSKINYFKKRASF